MFDVASAFMQVMLFRFVSSVLRPCVMLQGVTLQHNVVSYRILSYIISLTNVFIDRRACKCVCLHDM